MTATATINCYCFFVFLFLGLYAEIVSFSGRISLFFISPICLL